MPTGDISKGNGLNLFVEPYEVLFKVYSEGAHLKIALGDLPSGEHGRTVRISYGVLENDGYLGLCIRTFAEKQPKLPVRIVLKMALYAMLFLNIPRYAAVDDAVALVKSLGKGGAAGFVNAFLRRFDETKVRIPEGIEGLAIRSNFPRFAIEEVKEAYKGRAEQILLAKSHGVSVRFTSDMGAMNALPHEDTPFENVKIFKNFTREEGFFSGNYTFQSVGSVAVCAAVEPCKSLLDACAAPGGKSVLLSERCGQVTACELHPHRVKLIEAYCARMKRQNVTPVQGDASVFNPAWEKKFDGVLCDVPCSGLGTVSENPDLPLRCREENLPELNRLQGAILKNCSRYVREGGALYYATCSILPRENDGVVKSFLGGGGWKTVPITSPLAHDKTECGLQFLPDTAFGAGFYISKLQRL